MLRWERRWSRREETGHELEQTSGMTALDNQLLEVDRATLLRFMAQLIHHLTIHARANYDSPDCPARLREVNESIHRIAGHLRDLLDDSEPTTEIRAKAIASNADLLIPSQIDRLREWSGL